MQRHTIIMLFVSMWWVCCRWNSKWGEKYRLYARYSGVCEKEVDDCYCCCEFDEGVSKLTTCTNPFESLMLMKFVAALTAILLILSLLVTLIFFTVIFCCSILILLASESSKQLPHGNELSLWILFPWFFRVIRRIQKSNGILLAFSFFSCYTPNVAKPIKTRSI